jgi:hypothetical protein
MHITNRSVPWKFANGPENLVLQATKFQQMCICHKFPGGTGLSHYGPNESFMEGLGCNRLYV